MTANSTDISTSVFRLSPLIRITLLTLYVALSWSDVKSLKPRTTGQGGIVYYFVSHDGNAYLLPMRMAGFNRFVNCVQAKTGIDTTDVFPLAQPWMYVILFCCTLLLLLVDAWTINTAILGNL